jgi:hypothetical protein
MGRGAGCACTRISKITMSNLNKRELLNLVVLAAVVLLTYALLERWAEMKAFVVRLFT